MSTQPQFTIEQFYKFTRQGKLMAGRCLECGKMHLPPRPLCDNCYSTNFEWVEAPKNGKLLTYTVIHIAPTQFQNLAPYAVGIVELTEGLLITAGHSSAQALCVGRRGRVRHGRRAGGRGGRHNGRLGQGNSASQGHCGGKLQG